MLASRVRLRVANSLLRLAGLVPARLFGEALGQPRAAQHALLMRLLEKNEDSAYGRAHGFSRIRSVADFQSAVPVVDYDALEPWVERIRRGEGGVLTTEPVLMMEKTGGSSAASKYIPYTARLRAEFQAATSVWLHDLYSKRPALRGGASYWSVSPVAQVRETTPGGLPIGFEDDTAYFDPLERWVLAQVMRTPPELKYVPDMETNRYVTLRFLFEAEDLALISVWNPSFLTLLMETVQRHAERLLEDLRQGSLRPPQPLPQELQRVLASRLRPEPRRAAQLTSALADRGRLEAKAMWPRLALISCWTSASAARFLPELQATFPGVEIQSKGLLATEGVLSIPFLGHPGALPAIRSHFLEFAPFEQPGERPVLVDELEPGGRYEVVMTTGGGFYRYAIGDVVEVVGRLGATPLIEFVGKTAKVSDVCGEKLSELRVGQVIEEALARVGLTRCFGMLAPEWGRPPHYALFVATDSPEETVADLGRFVEQRLLEGHHYAYCRSLGQLGPVEAVRLGRDAETAYLTACEAMGQRAGDVKPAYLHRAFGWKDRLGCGYDGREAQEE